MNTIQSLNIMAQICISSLLPKEIIEIRAKSSSHQNYNEFLNTLNHLLSRRQKISPVPRQMVGGQVPSNNQNL